MMNNQRKNQKTAENPRKSRLFNRKTVETAPAFVQNKPKVKSPRIRLTAVLASIYAQMDNWLNAKNKAKQTQFKPNPANDLKHLSYCTLYRKTAFRRQKNKPNSNPTPKINTTISGTKTYGNNNAELRIKTNPNKADNQSSTSAARIGDNRSKAKAKTPDRSPPLFKSMPAAIPINKRQQLASLAKCDMIPISDTASKMQETLTPGIYFELRWEIMKNKLLFLVSAALVTNLVQTAAARDQPRPIHAGTRILRSGNLIVEVGDPDSADCRWNQGLRFSPVANIIQVTLNGREFCYAPVTGGALGYLGGLPMEFDIGQEPFQPDPPGYNEGSNGSPFLKIGVGILRRNSSSYNFSTNYPVIELAHTATTWQRDRARFIQTLSGDADGYSCRLEVDVIAKNHTLILNYVLTNTGSKTFTTEQYLHNFLSFGQTGVGPDYRVYFPYDMEVSPQLPLWQPPQFGQVGRVPGFIDNNPAMVALENMVLYTEVITSVPKAWIYKPEEYLGPDTVAVEQTDIAQRVVIDSSRRSAYIGIWTTSYQVSPEQFVFVTLEPEEKAEFTRTYKFSTDASIRQDCTGDGTVNGNDLLALSSTWLSDPSGANWDPSCDVSEPADDFINNKDLAALAQAWRRDANGPPPVAYWPMDEVSGMVAADAAGSYDGALVGFATDSSQWVSGHSGGGLEFDGIDDYVEIEGFSGVCGTKPRAVFAWVKANGILIGNLDLIAWGNKQPGGYWFLQVDDDQRLRLSCESGFISANEQQIADGDWHHIAVVLDPVNSARPLISDISLYVDGKRRTIYKMQEAPINTECVQNVRIGASYESDADPFAGVMDEVMIFDSAVSPTAVRRAYMK
jgi:hypothetical protein